MDALIGKRIRLRMCEVSDLKLIARWLRTPDQSEQGRRLAPVRLPELRKLHRAGHLKSWFLVETLAGQPIGFAMHYQTPKTRSRSVDVIISERGLRASSYDGDALELLCALVFQVYQVDRVYAEVLERDPYSRAEFRRIGFEEYKRALRQKLAADKPSMVVFCRLAAETWKHRIAADGSPLLSVVGRPTSRVAEAGFFPGGGALQPLGSDAAGPIDSFAAPGAGAGDAAPDE
ncbi:MAG: GNAT family N-acetyltransferase [Planctomycetes bacterium]|nr:GNAT family N-acetyltransferase [Planctomycetota bacterium]